MSGKTKAKGKEAPVEAPKVALPTSAEVFDIIRNDPFLFSNRIKIGYYDGRKKKILYTPFNEWRPVSEGGDVPWHRVEIMTYTGADGVDTPLWDRATRTCRVKEIHDANKSLVKADYGTLSLVTFNILNDKADSRSFARRQEGILTWLRTTAPTVDFVLLQEVPEAFLAPLEAAVQELGLQISTTAGTKDIVDHLAIITRFDIVDARPVLLGRAKAFLTIDVFAEDMATIRIANVHLTSGMQTDSASKRMEQLLDVVRNVGATSGGSGGAAAGGAGSGSGSGCACHAIIAGDFNERELLSLRGYRDALAASGRELEAFHTISPPTNPLAKGSPGAVDRVLFSPHWALEGLRVATDVAGLSDHHPLHARLQLRDVVVEDHDAGAAGSGGAETAASSGARGGAGAAAASSSSSGAGGLDVKTALCIVLPFERWGPLLGLRAPITASSAAAVAKADRWMPHVSISLGFVPEDEFFTVEPAIARILASFLPMRIAFGPASVLSHEAAHSVVLEVEPAVRTQLQLMRDALSSIVRMEHSGGSRGEGYRPHVTLQRCPTKEAADRLARRLGSSLSFSFTCHRLACVSRESTTYMRVVNTIGPAASATSAGGAGLSAASAGSAVAAAGSTTAVAGSAPASRGSGGSAAAEDALRADMACIEAVIRHHCSAVRVMGSCLLLPSDAADGAGAKLSAGAASGAAASDAATSAALSDATASGGDIDLQVRLKPGHGPESLSRSLETCGAALLVKPVTTRYGRILRVFTKSPTLAYDLHVYLASGSTPGGAAAVASAGAAAAGGAGAGAGDAVEDAAAKDPEPLEGYEAAVAGDGDDGTGSAGSAFKAAADPAAAPAGTLAPTGMDVLMQIAAKAGHAQLLSDCSRVVKAGLKACGVYGQRYGFIPGYGVSLMVHRLITAGVIKDPSTAVAAFCGHWAPQEPPWRSCNPAKSFADASSRFIAVQDVCAPGENILRTVTTASFSKLRRALAAGLEPGGAAAADAAAFPFWATITMSAPTLRMSDTALSWFGSSFLSLVLRLERSNPLSHDADWSPAPTTDDYPFAWRFTLRSSVSLGTRAVDVFEPLQRDFYAMLERCAFVVEYGSGAAAIMRISKYFM